MQIGDLVRSKKFPEKVGVVVDIFKDLDPEKPWIRIRWTSPGHSYEWCKQPGLILLSEGAPKES
jgi:mannose/cellobiose epimerase-like protein (N-acyl-D-glucosamine 2-epimerase family)